MSLASAAAVAPNLEKRPIAVMGDGGFWHNGLITGVASNLFNKGDGVLIVMQNGYASATGQQYLPSSTASRQGAAPGMDIERTLRSLGVTWLRKVRTYGVAKMVAALKDAMRIGRARAEGDHRRRRMPARAPAPRARRGCREAQARRARGEDALRRRRRDLHRRPFLHPALGLPVADGEAQSRSAAHRSGGDGDRELRRLRAVRRGRACRGAVPVVLPRRGGAQSECVGPRCCIGRAARSIGSVAAAMRTLSPHGQRAPSPRAGRGSGRGGYCTYRQIRNPSSPPLSPMGEGADQPAAAAEPAHNSGPSPSSSPRLAARAAAC